MTISRPRYALFLVVLFTFVAAADAAVPAAPSNLRLISKTWNSFTFAWDDNAIDETSQPLFISEGGQPFYLITAYRANATRGALLHLNPGRLYRIYLTARNASGDSAPSNRLDVFIPAPELKSQFAWLPLRPTVDDVITFYDGSFGSPSRWAWDFGDGTTASVKNPLKQYAAPGEYPVTLRVTSASGESTSTEIVRVTAGSGGGEALVAAFDCGTCAAVAGDEIAFTDTTTGGPTEWHWNLGDGSTSTERNPRHAYAAPGAYTASLVATRGTSTSFHSRTVTISAPPRPASLLIPVAGRVAGGGGSEWRTELTITNFGAITADLTLRLLPVAGNAELTRAIAIEAGASRSYSDVIAELFGLENGSGAIEITALPSNILDEIGAQSRTFTTFAAGGSMGQFIPAVRLPRPAAAQLLAGVETGEAYRTNIGLVNSGDQAARVTLTLNGGGPAARKEFDLPPRSWQQQPLIAMLDSSSIAQESLSISIEADGDVLAYASVIDRTTNDPTYHAGSLAPETPMQLLSVVGRTPGAGGTLWRTDVTLLNPSASASQVRLRIPGTAFQQDLTLDGNESRVLRDVALQLGAEAMTGALEIESVSPPVVTARTYTVLSDGGTLGQSIDVVSSTAANARSHLAGLRHDEGVRANIGLVERSGTPNAIHLELRDRMGSLVAETDIHLPANTQWQARLTEIFPAIDITSLAGPLRLDMQSAAGVPFVAYASLVDNRSGDPLFIPGRSAAYILK
ncbi:MAG: PKD domain-containing protein [Thermoanaerobaculia bacterium]